MKRMLLLIFFLIPLLFLMACGSESSTPAITATPSPNPGEIALNMIQQQMAAEATSQVVGLQFTATAQVMGVTATHQAVGTQEAVTQQARMDAQATADQIRRDAQATQQRIDLEATQVQARLDLSATQKAEEVQRAFMLTQAVAPTHDMWTARAVEQQIIIATNDVELSNLAVQQQQQTNTLEWAIPMGIAVLLTVGLLAYVYSQAQIRVIPNGDGDADVIIFKNERAFKPALLPKPMLILGTGEMPDMTNQAEQSEIVRREQGIKALSVMPVSPAGHGVTAFNSFFSEEKKEQPYEIVQADALPAELIDAEAMRAIEHDWEKKDNE